MEKIFKPLITIIGIIIIVLIVFSLFFVNNSLKMARGKLDESQAKIDQALKQLDYSKNKIDSIKNDLNKFGSYVVDVQGRVHILDLERRLNDVKFSTKRDSIRGILKKLYPDIPITDDIPENIPIEH